MENIVDVIMNKSKKKNWRGISETGIYEIIKSTSLSDKNKIERIRFINRNQ